MNKISVDYVNKNYNLICDNLDKIKQKDCMCDTCGLIHNIECNLDNIMQVIKGHRNYLRP